MSQASKQVATIKLKVIPGSAVPGGAIAAPLGQKGVSAKNFVENFNEITKNQKGSVLQPVGVKIKVFEDKSIQIIANKALSVSDLVKETLKIPSIKSTTGTRLIMKRHQVEEIAKKKQADLCVKSLDKAISIITGTLRSMAINIED